MGGAMWLPGAGRAAAAVVVPSDAAAAALVSPSLCGGGEGRPGLPWAGARPLPRRREVTGRSAAEG